ncbi:hypothetical protein NUW58_g1929 [Xylaria curta]|uniref:Uncharacterized protein n=1 Tax=Xylaria curta TaxID=42375 RepID=A0ACC1PJM4_9PEZI|nr:hypothetical protein NUW58_g1929 [Xylaria curta]
MTDTPGPAGTGGLAIVGSLNYLQAEATDAEDPEYARSSNKKAITERLGGNYQYQALNRYPRGAFMQRT